ncbi:MAG: hypothetical protein JRH20_14965 [Deltaproteobacteria bacterium]|nr:hypothetical protein [Deltaproteobacteria bacterium]
MARIFSREFTEEVIAACNADLELLAQAKLLSGDMVFLASDTPDSKDVQVRYHFDAGRCTTYDFVEEAAPSALREQSFHAPVDGLARVSAPYKIFVELDKGVMEPADALNSPDYAIEGNKMLLLPLMQAVMAFTEKVRGLPKTYE